MRKKLYSILMTGAFTVLFSMIAFAGQWKQSSGGWWWDNGDGTYPKSTWQWCDGNYDGTAECYYFDANGICLVNTTTPDGYTVDPSGAWIIDGVTQTKTVAVTNPPANSGKTTTANNTTATVSGSGSSSKNTSSASTTATTTYIGNKNSHIFHRPTCKTLPMEHNRIYFSSRTAAINAGHRACKNCKP